LTQDSMDNINDGTTNVRIAYKYLSDAFAEGEYTVFGSWSDDENNEGTLDASLDGFCDSGLTTSTSIDVDVEYGFKIDKDGYAIILDNNLLASGNTEKSSLTITPYGENATSGVWVEYNAVDDLTGDVAFSTGNVDTNQIIFQAETTGDCLHTLVSDSSSDAVVDGDEKMYDCFAGKNAKGYNAEVTWSLSVDEVLVDYDDSVTANDEELNCASGSSGENLFDIDVVGIVSATDYLAQTLSP
jgi:hypothetical protein